MSNISNFLSFNPQFVFPVSSPIQTRPRDGIEKFSTGREISSGSRDQCRATILGFHKISFFRLLLRTGTVPIAHDKVTKVPFESLEQIRKSSGRPIVVFPECTTSNGRGLLKFADAFVGTSIPVRDYQVFIMCIRQVSSPSYLTAITCKPGMTHQVY
jgi:hypothetical protein